MKKIIVSAAVAALALTTTASALEDIKVNGQAKVWYETHDKNDNALFNKKNSSGEVVFKLGITGKQGNVGFGATVYDTSTMGLEDFVVGSAGVRTETTGAYKDVAAAPGTDADTDNMYVGEAYITAPIMGATLKFGKQELDTPLLFTERWNAAPNTYNGAVAIIPAASNLTVVGAYVGQGSAGNGTGWMTSGTPMGQINGDGAFALGALYKTDAMAVNAWYYALPSTASALWVDASMKMGAANVKAVVATMMPDEIDTNTDGKDDENTLAVALSGGAKVAGWSLSAAVSSVGAVDDGGLAVANVGTGYKKTKLPTAGVYTDGVYVAVPGSTAIKVKAAGKVGSTGLAIQAVNNTNGETGYEDKETTEIDLIVSQKLGDFNIKGIVLNRSFADSTTDDTSGGNHVRLIVSTNF